MSERTKKLKSEMGDCADSIILYDCVATVGDGATTPTDAGTVTVTER